jgi:hypothetical protein
MHKIQAFAGLKKVITWILWRDLRALSPQMTCQAEMARLHVVRNVHAVNIGVPKAFVCGGTISAGLDQLQAASETGSCICMFLRHITLVLFVILSPMHTFGDDNGTSEQVLGGAKRSYSRVDLRIEWQSLRADFRFLDCSEVRDGIAARHEGGEQQPGFNAYHQWVDQV